MASADILRAAHSPLPWSQDGDELSSGHDHLFYVVSERLHRTKDVANAAFIVRACNAHYDMLAALKATEILLETDGHVNTLGIVRAAIAAAEAEAGR